MEIKIENIKRIEREQVLNELETLVKENKAISNHFNFEKYKDDEEIKITKYIKENTIYYSFWKFEEYITILYGDCTIKKEN